MDVRDKKSQSVLSSGKDHSAHAVSGPCRLFFVEARMVARSLDVITSYSIHYTKLYDITIAERNHAQFAAGFADRPLGTDQHAPTTAMAEFAKNQHLLADDGQGVEAADLLAFFAEGALVEIHQRDRGVDLFALADLLV